MDLAPRHAQPRHRWVLDDPRAMADLARGVRRRGSTRRTSSPKDASVARRPGSSSAVHDRLTGMDPRVSFITLAVTEAAKAGAQTWPAQDREWGGYSGYFADQDGYCWEVAWNPYPIAAMVLPEVDA